MNGTKWHENIILVDADYVDKVVFDLIVNFERMIGRRIPQADMAKWIECIALDGGMRPVDSSEKLPSSHSSPLTSIQVILLHHHQQMDNFMPNKFADLDGKAFKSELGEFLISCVPVEELVTMEELFIESLQVLVHAAEVKRLMVVSNAESIYNKVRETIRKGDPDKHITVFAMQPMEGGQFRQEILGYSLMAALGIHANEIK